MKKEILSKISLLTLGGTSLMFMTALLSSCSNKMEETFTTNNPHKVTIGVSAPDDGLGTRVQWYEDYTNKKGLFKWDENDQISVLTKDGTIQETFTLSSGKDKASGTFQNTNSTLQTKSQFVAVWPQQNYTVTDVNGQKAITLDLSNQDG